jgi:hypothetical protein
MVRILFPPGKSRRTIGSPAETRRGELDRLSALQDRVDKLWVQKGKIDEAPDVAPTDAVALRQIVCDWA